jgi:hypothetical protein
MEETTSMPANVKRLLHHGASVPAHLAFQSLNLPPVERLLYLRHIRAKEAYKTRLPELSPLESQIAREMIGKGVAITSLADLAIEGTEEMLAAGAGISARLTTPLTRSQDPARATSYRKLFAWGLDLSLLRIAEAYFGLPAAYDGPKVVYTPADGRQRGTRLWHRDREDRRMMKIAIYLTDVPESGGPIQCIRHEIFDGPIDRDFRYPVLSHSQLERKLARPIDDKEITSCTGPAGTVVFMDTARLFHRGKPAVSTERIAIFHSYFSRAPRHPFFCERSDLSRSELAQFAKSMKPIQQDAVMWRTTLNLPMRLVPKSIT